MTSREEFIKYLEENNPELLEEIRWEAFYLQVMGEEYVHNQFLKVLDEVERYEETLR